MLGGLLLPWQNARKLHHFRIHCCCRLLVRGRVKGELLVDNLGKRDIGKAKPRPHYDQRAITAAELSDAQPHDVDQHLAVWDNG